MKLSTYRGEAGAARSERRAREGCERCHGTGQVETGVIEQGQREYVDCDCLLEEAEETV